MLAAAGGCQILSMAGYAFFPEKVDAQFRLPKVPTFIVVDDGKKLLGNPALTVRMANQIGFELTSNDAVGTLIPPERINALVAEFGDDYYRTPIATLGREVGAQLVIHIEVDLINVATSADMLKPTATVRVKVIDIESRRRLFPVTDADAVDPDTTVSPRGWAVRTQLSYRQEGGRTSTDLALLAQRLTDRIAIDVARLFYKYEAPLPSFDDD